MSKYELLADYGEICTKNRKGIKNSLRFCKESWNGYECFAIREFSPDGKPEKGVTFKPENLERLKELLEDCALAHPDILPAKRLN